MHHCVLWSGNYWFPKTLTKQERPNVCWDADKMVVFLWIWIGLPAAKKKFLSAFQHTFSPSYFVRALVNLSQRNFQFSFHFNSSIFFSLRCTYSQFLMDIWYYSNFKKISKKTGHNALVLLPILRPFLFIRELIFKWSSCISHERPTPLHSNAIWSYLFQSALFVCLFVLTPSERDSSNLFGD